MGGDRIPSIFDRLRDDPEKAAEKLLRWAQEAYMAEFKRLDGIAVFVVNSAYGVFLKRMASAWLHADPWNKRILRQAWERLVKKYDIAGEYERSALEGG